jgi:hypothetical protein
MKQKRRDMRWAGVLALAFVAFGCAAHRAENDGLIRVVLVPRADITLPDDVEIRVIVRDANGIAIRQQQISDKRFPCEMVLPIDSRWTSVDSIRLAARGLVNGLPAYTCEGRSITHEDLRHGRVVYLVLVPVMD